MVTFLIKKHAFLPPTSATQSAGARGSRINSRTKVQTPLAFWHYLLFIFSPCSFNRGEGQVINPN